MSTLLPRSIPSMLATPAPLRHLRRAGQRIAALAVALAAFLPGTPASACTRILWNAPGQAVIVGRNMDFEVPMPSNLWALPRGLQRTGGTGPQAARWTSRYGSVVTASYDTAVVDGMNERGLNVNALWLSTSRYGPPAAGRSTVATAMWAQYMLDNYASVAEAVASLRSGAVAVVGIAAVLSGGHAVTPVVHIAIADASGDSAVFEYIDGQLAVYHSPRYTVMTNDPPYRDQLARLSTYAGFGGQAPLPGTNEPTDRFVRAGYYLQALPKPGSAVQEVTELVSVMRNVAQPFRVNATKTTPDQFPTRWTTVADLTNMRYYFADSSAPGAVWVNLGGLDLSEKGRVMKVDLVGHPLMTGDVTASLRPAAMFDVVFPVP